MEQIKNLIRRNALYRSWDRRRQALALARWARETPGAPPPHLFKQQVIRSHARRFSIRTLVETGTFLGQMVEAMAPHFERVYSIELDPALHQRAKLRFSHLSNVSLRLGDSGRLLPEVLGQVDGPCLLWLDGHYSGGVTARGVEDTPIQRELDAVFARDVREDVILIDDARCFDGQNGYPALQDIVRLLADRGRRTVTVAEDIIRACPNVP